MSYRLGLPLVCLLLTACGGSDPTAAPTDDAGVTDSNVSGGDSAITTTDGGGESAAGGAFLERTAGGRRYKLYVPSAHKAGANLPLVLMLHGCTQDPDDFAAGTRMNDVGEAKGWLVAWPEQPKSAQPYQCWQWWEPGNQQRGKGEAASLAGVVDDVRAAYGVDAKHVYAAGLSAGAAMTVVLGATYPDVFAAIGVHAGVEYAAATSAVSSLDVTKSGGPSPDAQGDAAWKAMGSYARVVPTLVIHGTADKVVAPINGTQVVAQWVRTNDRADDGLANGTVPSAPTATTTGAAEGKTFQSTSYADKSGKIVVQSYVINGLSHAWSGGDLAGTWTETGPSATAWLTEFFAAR